MDIIRAVVLGIVQGATEFIPVSSSGHLVLVPWLLAWPPPGLVFDTVVHWGTLVAVLVYFWHDWWQLILAWVRGLFRWDWSNPDARLMWLILLGTLPAAVIGFALEDFFEALFGQPVWVSIFLLITAALLAIGEWLGRKTRSLEELHWPDAVLIGLGQAAAIAPGISRSGATISVALLRGVKRPAAARFSFLLGTPIIFAAGLFKLGELVAAPGAVSQLPVLIAGFAAAAVTGYFCIWLLLRYLQEGSLYPFSIYCAAVGLLFLLVVLLR